MKNKYLNFILLLFFFKSNKSENLKEIYYSNLEILNNSYKKKHEELSRFKKELNNDFLKLNLLSTEIAEIYKENYSFITNKDLEKIYKDILNLEQEIANENNIINQQTILNNNNLKSNLVLPQNNFSQPPVLQVQSNFQTTTIQPKTNQLNSKTEEKISVIQQIGEKQLKDLKSLEKDLINIISESVSNKSKNEDENYDNFLDSFKSIDDFNKYKQLMTIINEIIQNYERFLLSELCKNIKDNNIKKDLFIKAINGYQGDLPIINSNLVFYDTFENKIIENELSYQLNDLINFVINYYSYYSKNKERKIEEIQLGYIPFLCFKYGEENINFKYSLGKKYVDLNVNNVNKIYLFNNVNKIFISGKIDEIFKNNAVDNFKINIKLNLDAEKKPIKFYFLKLNNEKNNRISDFLFSGVKDKINFSNGIISYEDKFGLLKNNKIFNAGSAGELQKITSYENFKYEDSSISSTALASWIKNKEYFIEKYQKNISKITNEEIIKKYEFVKIKMPEIKAKLEEKNTQNKNKEQNKQQEKPIEEDYNELCKKFIEKAKEISNKKIANEDIFDKEKIDKFLNISIFNAENAFDIYLKTIFIMFVYNIKNIFYGYEDNDAIEFKAIEYISSLENTHDKNFALKILEFIKKVIKNEDFYLMYSVIKQGLKITTSELKTINNNFLISNITNNSIFYPFKNEYLQINKNIYLEFKSIPDNQKGFLEQLFNKLSKIKFFEPYALEEINNLEKEIGILPYSNIELKKYQSINLDLDLYYKILWAYINKKEIGEGLNNILKYFNDKNIDHFNKDLFLSEIKNLKDEDILKLNLEFKQDEGLEDLRDLIFRNYNIDFRIKKENKNDKIKSQDFVEKRNYELNKNYKDESKQIKSAEQKINVINSNLSMKGDIVLFRINNNTISANIKDVNNSSPDENGTNAAKIANYLEKNSYKIETDKNKNLIIKKEDEED